MRTLQVRRHAMRHKPGQHLTPAGIDLARRVGAALGPFELVVTSPLPRAIETALAMGFAVDETAADLARMPAAIGRDWPLDFAAVTAAVGAGGAAAVYAAKVAALWQGIIERVPEGGQALVVTHGGIVELGAVAAVPHCRHASWGEAIGYCEGAQLTYAGRFIDGDVLRVPEEHRQVRN